MLHRCALFAPLFQEPSSDSIWRCSGHLFMLVLVVVSVLSAMFSIYVSRVVQALFSRLAWLFGLSVWSRCRPSSPHNSCSMLCPFPSMLVPVRGSRCLLGSLFGTFLGRWSVNSAFIFKLRLLWLLSESPRLGNSPQLKLTKPLKDSTANGLRGWSGGMRGAIESARPKGQRGL